MPKKFISCVKKISKSSPNVNPYAVCRKSTGYYGTTHHIGLIHPLRNKVKRTAKRILSTGKNNINVNPAYS